MIYMKRIWAKDLRVWFQEGRVYTKSGNGSFKLARPGDAVALQDIHKLRFYVETEWPEEDTYPCQKAAIKSIKINEFNDEEKVVCTIKCELTDSSREESISEKEDIDTIEHSLINGLCMFCKWANELE